ncbi:hypothetical protein E2C01_086106 [Portunus trituberculatus]|uniref:Uncharacterized protein n=1 Tax=Portunus trituberculatus TaxID=210409 RepID=A0A5B7IZW4_PORTR|nr:hypothetical protein [Portunus trituberculatus]
MAHSVPSFMASCSARCHYKQEICTQHSPPDSMQGALITPLGLLTASSGSASGRLVVKLEPPRKRRTCSQFLALGPRPDPTATSFPPAAPKAVTALTIFRPKVLNRRFNFSFEYKIVDGK